MPLVDIRHYGVIIIKIISFFKEENQAESSFLTRHNGTDSRNMKGKVWPWTGSTKQCFVLNVINSKHLLWIVQVKEQHFKVRKNLYALTLKATTLVTNGNNKMVVGLLTKLGFNFNQICQKFRTQVLNIMNFLVKLVELSHKSGVA